MKKKSRLYYLASPYSHPDREVMNERAEIATKAAVDLLKLGYITFAPIPYNCHWEKYNLPGNWEFWEHFDKTFLDHVDGLIVLKIDGWDRSIGVAAEIEYARGLLIPIIYLTIDDIENGNIDALKTAEFGMNFNMLEK